MITVFPFVGKVDNKLIYFVFRSDINTSCRLVKQQHRRVCQKPASQNYLLLVASRKRAYLGLLIRGLYTHGIYAPVGCSLSFSSCSGTVPTYSFSRLEIVAFSRIFNIPKIPVARRSSVRSANPFFMDSLRDSCSLMVFPFKLYLFRCVLRCDAENVFQKLGSARTVKSGNADYLALVSP